MTKFERLCATTSHQIGRFCADEGGATAIEYAMIAAGVGVAIAATVTALGSSVKGMYTRLSGMM